jgi:hypothetical protein
MEEAYETHLQKEAYKHYLLGELGLQRLAEKLKDYKVVDELPEFQIGTYIRWLKDGELVIGGNIINIQMEKDGPHLLCKNQKRFFVVQPNHTHVFQKLTKSDKLVLDVLKRLK